MQPVGAHHRFGLWTLFWFLFQELQITTTQLLYSRTNFHFLQIAVKFANSSFSLESLLFAW